MNINFLDLTKADSSLQLEIRNWRNSTHVAQYFQLDYIDLQTHKNWLESLSKEQPQNIAFLIEFDEKFVGLAYFSKIDYKEKQADWGMYIYDQSLRGMGIGSKVLDFCFDYIRNLGINRLFLEVLRDNHRAISLYEKKGFKYCEDKNELVSRYKIIL